MKGPDIGHNELMADPFGDLEPGQDDLIKDDNVTRSIARAAKDLPRALTGEGEDDIYTNHRAGSLDEFTPKAERDPGPARRSGGGPVGGSIMDKIKALLGRK